MRRRQVLFLMLGAAACSASVPAPEAEDPSRRRSSIKLEGIPHVRQRPDFCGEACVAMVLAKNGRDLSQEAVFDASGLDPKLGRGCYTPELVRAVERLGFEPGTVWAKLDHKDTHRSLDASWSLLHERLLAGVPSIVCMHYDDSPDTTEHFRLIVGYDSEADEVLFHEPAEDDGAYRRMPRAEFFELWPVDGSGGTSTLIQIALEQRSAIDPGAAPHIRPAEYAQRVRELRDRLDPGEFAVTVEHPFVVIGDDGAVRLDAYCAGVVRWTVSHLRRQFFEASPTDLVEVYLFRDGESYRKNAKRLFGDDPDTPYGYYSPEHEALVMNIGTGGGTLVHEIVHPFMAANFPSCPSWFNEGLASLYEQSAERDGKIVGLTNWRLPGLQQAIRDELVPPFAELTASGERPFYDDDPGTNYAQARYLCYWLQEQGVLEEFYAAFVAAASLDPTGHATLQDIVRRETGTNLVEFQPTWERWVLGLKQD